MFLPLFGVVKCGKCNAKYRVKKKFLLLYLSQLLIVGILISLLKPFDEINEVILRLVIYAILFYVFKLILIPLEKVIE